MKRFGLLFLGMVFVLGFGKKGYTQCTPANITKSEYCTGQPAEIIIDDADPNVKYHWYSDQLFDLNYGETGDGKLFLSPNDLFASSAKTFNYIKETAADAGPAYRTPSGGASYDTELGDYAILFDASMPFKLEEVTVVVEMSQATQNYYFELAHEFNGDESFSSGFIGKQSDFENISGNLYKVTFSVNGLDSIPAGNNHKISLRSSDDPGGDYLAVDNFYWWPQNEYAGASYAGGVITTQDPTAFSKYR